eukprot:2995064-Lingulodinium_polyedra.AAC.1
MCHPQYIIDHARQQDALIGGVSANGEPTARSLRVTRRCDLLAQSMTRTGTFCPANISAGLRLCRRGRLSNSSPPR